MLLRSVREPRHRHRNALMAEHMKAMQDGMGMMKGMSGMSTKGSMGGMGAMPTPRACRPTWPNITQ